VHCDVRLDLWTILLLPESPRPAETPHVARIISSDSIPAGGFTPGTVLADRYRIIGLLGREGMDPIVERLIRRCRGSFSMQRSITLSTIGSMSRSISEGTVAISLDCFKAQLF
jgi:hypothetical protein